MENIWLQSFLHTKGRTLRLLYAWFHHLSFQKLWQSRMRYVLNQTDSIESMIEKLNEWIDAYEWTSDDELQLQFLLELADFLEIDVYSLKTEDDIIKLMSVIIDQAVELLLEMDPSFTGHSLFDILEYQFKKRCEWVDSWYKGLEKNQKEYFGSVLKSFLVEQSYSSNNDETKRWRQLSLSTLHTTIEEQGIFGLFATALKNDETFVLMKQLMTFFNEHIFLETNEEKMVEDVNRSFIIEIESTAFPHWMRMNKEVLFHGEKQALRQLLLPVLITEIILLQAPMKEVYRVDGLLSAYADVVNRYQRYIDQIEQLEEEKQTIQEINRQFENENSHYYDEMKKIEKEQDARIQQIYQYIHHKKIPLRASDLTYTSLLTQRNLLLEQLKKPQIQKRERKGLSKILTPFETMNYKRKIEQEIESIEEQLIMLIVEHRLPGICKQEVMGYHESVLKQKDIYQTIEENKKNIEKNKHQIEQIQERLEKKIKKKQLIKQQFYIHSKENEEEQKKNEQ